MTTALEVAKPVTAGAAAFLAADSFVKGLPPTTGWALGWGAVATTGTYLVARKVVSPAVAFAATVGLASAYLHAYGHQTAYPHRK